MLEGQASQVRNSYNGMSGDARALQSQKVVQVQQSALFSDIPFIDCANIVSSGHEKQFARRQTIFFEGDPSGQIWLLVSGCVKITQFGQNGTEVILRVSGSGEVLGTLGTSQRGRQCATAQALKPSRVLLWDTNVFEALSDRFPVLRRNIARILEERLRDMEERFREISTEKVASRLSSQLVRLAAQIGRREMEGIEVSLSQLELAQLTGTTLFTVSRLLSQWEQRGAVKTRREAVSICNLQALSSIAESE